LIVVLAKGRILRTGSNFELPIILGARIEWLAFANNMLRSVDSGFRGRELVLVHLYQLVQPSILHEGVLTSSSGI
jgi:hypothetical protein